MFRFSLPHALIAALLFGVEVCIAAFVNDDFVRPYVGDLLVVILIHYGLRAFLRISVNAATISTLLFAFAVEGTQALGLIHRLGLTDNLAAKLILGNTFQWGDLLVYAVGVPIAWWSDRRWFDRDPGVR